MSELDHIIVVCTANICRSPMGERLLAHALAAEEAPLNQLQVISAGIAAQNGQAPSPNSVQAMRSVGLDLNDHRSRQIDDGMLQRAFAIFCMTETHRALLQAYFDELPAHLYLFRELMPAGSPKEIPDPYGGPLPEYETCRDSMVEAVPSLLNFLRQAYR